MSCLLDASDQEGVRLQSDCRRMLSERKEMWEYAAQEGKKIWGNVLTRHGHVWNDLLLIAMLIKRPHTSSRIFFLTSSRIFTNSSIRTNRENFYEQGDMNASFVGTFVIVA